jgi:DtxR family transcriptional regulator, Mn-dependent transcriptional regulator
MLSISDLKAGHPVAPQYLADIYLMQRDYGYANNARLAEWLGVTRSAVSQAVGRLKNLGLVEQDDYGAVRLLAEGRHVAECVLRRHYLIEHLLVRVLDYPWDKADEEAARIQETISDDFTEHLFRYLGSPETCPHGNPFPGTPGEARLVDARKLSEAAVGDRVRILRITEEGENVPGMLTACYEHRISPGNLVRIISSDDSSVSLEFVDRKAAFSLQLDYARHIRVEPASARP